MNGSSVRYRCSICCGVRADPAPFGSFCSVSQRRFVIPLFLTRSLTTAANFWMLPLFVSNVPPCQVMLMIEPACCASWTVLTNDAIRSGSPRSIGAMKMRAICGCSATIFASMSPTFCGVTPTSRLIFA